MENRLKEIINGVRPLDAEAMDRAKSRQAQLAKPPGSLGKLEDISIQLAGITGRVNNQVKRKRLIVLASDNGVVAEGVASTPKSVTLSQTINLTRGITGASALAHYFGDEVVVVDMGVEADYNCPQVINRKIAYGTKNLAVEPAMTREQALLAIHTGIELALAARDDRVDIIGVGEMGIGNTTTSAAVLSALLNLPAEETTGRGAGLDDEGLAKKKRVIDSAIKLHKPDRGDPVDVLSKVGGFDLAAMTGVYIGAAYSRIPVVADGLISIVAALSAVKLCPEVRGYIIPSHESFEKGYLTAIRELELEPYLKLDMRLGEGSGCPLAFRIVEAACAIMNGMATFKEAEINDAYVTELRDNEDIYFGRV
jgi:nicotinate-nucleotide--dimethylbenzimidazole phosphoribosyltransferase